MLSDPQPLPLSLILLLTLFYILPTIIIIVSLWNFNRLPKWARIAVGLLALATMSLWCVSSSLTR